MASAQQPRGFGRFGVGVLDGLGLVEHDVVELHVLKLQRVAPQRSVGSHDRVISRETVAGARQASVIEHAQLRREARGFLHPVEDQRLGDHHQGWP